MDKLDEIIKQYDLDDCEKEYLINLIYPIYCHMEFQKRLTDEYLHHGDITLGEHILKDTIKTYFLCQRKNKKKNKVDTSLSIKISMLHDLYTSPWQNSDYKTKFFHRHGFRHPVEAAINAAYWFPAYFNDKDDARIIIDGIIHHMFPLPVSSTKMDIKSLEIRNYDLFIKLDKSIQNEILDSIKRKSIKDISITRSKYKEGRIMSRADKMMALREIKDFSSAKSLITGTNKKIKKRGKI